MTDGGVARQPAPRHAPACAVEPTGALAFSQNGRVRDLPVSLQLGAGREFCFNGEIERGDECVGATLRAGGRTSTAEEVCFDVRG